MHAARAKPAEGRSGPALVHVAQFVGFGHRHLDQQGGGFPVAGVGAFGGGAKGALGQLIPGPAASEATERRFVGNDGRGGLSSGHVSRNPPSTHKSVPVM